MEDRIRTLTKETVDNTNDQTNKIIKLENECKYLNEKLNDNNIELNKKESEIEQFNYNIKQQNNIITELS